jgi:orotate phosphoribosyltransferase
LPPFLLDRFGITAIIQRRERSDKPEGSPSRFAASCGGGFFPVLRPSHRSVPGEAARKRLTTCHRAVNFNVEEWMTDAERQLLTLLRDRCYSEREVTLSSGEKSNFYFDAKMLLMSSAGASLIGEILYERTKDLDVQAVGGLEIGAVPLTTAAVYAYHRHGQPMEGFFVRNEAKKHGTMKLVEGNLRPGSRVAIVDDVATKGGSIMRAVDAVRRAECQPVRIIVLVDRRQGAAELFAREGISFDPVFTIDHFRPTTGK